MTRWEDTGHRVKRDRVIPIAPRCLQRKYGFPTRKMAKQFIRERQLNGCRPYPCVQPDCELFHVGHLPPQVIAGTMARADLAPRHKPRAPRQREAS